MLSNVVRPFFSDQVPDGAFSAAISFGDGIESMPALLVRDIDTFAEVRPDRRAAGIGKPALRIASRLANANPPPAAKACIYPRTPRTSPIGRSPTGACCCST